MTNNRLGILGGGQLALMLGDAATRLGLKPIIFTENPDDPAADRHPGAVFGRVSDASALEKFFSQVELVIFENEFVDCAKLKEVSERFPVQFLPSLDVLAIFQDKLKQKRLLDRLQIPTSEYVEISEVNPEKSIQDACSRFGGESVLKWSRMGYDGKGVLPVRTQDKEKAHAFFLEAVKRGGKLYAERKINFKREVVLISTYSIKKEFRSYPLMLSEQNQGICWRVSGPAISLGVSPEAEKAATGYARSLAESASLFGTFAIEFFETQDGHLLVNEIAPRVHNGGHFSQNAGMVDQFENHWRAVLGYPLGETHTAGAYAMLNVLGKTTSCVGVQPLPTPRGRVHWYGKREVRPGRKMGHLNGRVDDAKELGGLLNELQKSIEDWENKIGDSK